MTEISHEHVVACSYKTKDEKQADVMLKRFKTDASEMVIDNSGNTQVRHVHRITHEALKMV